MLTSPITTPVFQSRVLGLLSESLASNHPWPNSKGRDDTVRSPRISPLSFADTPLTPEPITPRLLAFTSAWVDLSSPDPLIFELSKQVLLLEVAYAAFCGIESVFVQGPKLYHGEKRTYGAAQYARAIQEALNVGSHLQIHILLPMIDDHNDDENDEMGHLAPFTREEYLMDAEDTRPSKQDKQPKTDIFGTWDAWNVIRSVCKYSSRLFVGKKQMLYSLPQLPIERVFSRMTAINCSILGGYLHNQVLDPIVLRDHASLHSRM